MANQQKRVIELNLAEAPVTSAKKVIGTQVNMQEYLKLKDIAEADFMSISDVLRKIIILYLRSIENIDK